MTVEEVEAAGLARIAGVVPLVVATHRHGDLLIRDVFFDQRHQHYEKNMLSIYLLMTMGTTTIMVVPILFSAFWLSATYSGHILPFSESVNNITEKLRTSRTRPR